MLTRIRTLKNQIRVAVLALIPLVAGCGGGGGDDASPSDGGDSLGTTLVTCIIVTLATGQAGCGSSGSSSPPSSPPPSPPPPPPPSSSGAALVIRPYNELEPNGDLATANLPTYPTRSSPGQRVGWYAVGSINDVTDITDAFAFTPNQTREYYLSLCPPEGSICDDNSRIDTLTAFFRVLDQDGTVLFTSEADTIDGNKYFATLAAGVLYYVTVDAGDTMGVTVDYRLYVYENS